MRFEFSINEYMELYELIKSESQRKGITERKKYIILSMLSKLQLYGKFHVEDSILEGLNRFILTLRKKWGIDQIHFLKEINKQR